MHHTHDAPRLAHDTPDTTELVVSREGEPRGRLWWRRAHYTVYRVSPDGTRVRVLAGEFRDHAAALRAARASSR